MFFDRQEYEGRWAKVAAVMEARGYDNVVVWQRSAGTYDRIGHVYWLTNFRTNGTGQDAPSEEVGAPWTFSAVLLRKGHEPELHVGLPLKFTDPSTYCYGELHIHEPHLMLGLAEYLRANHIEGRVGIVGDDTLPGMYDRLLRRHTPQIEWVAAEDLLSGPQSIKSARELEAFRIAGDIASRALTATVEALIAGETSAEAASRAAQLIVRESGGYHRIDVTHGLASERLVLSDELYGYNACAPCAGDIVRAWIYGPIFQGYWLDPGRTAVCGNRPSAQRRSLIEDNLAVVDTVIAAIRPGRTPRELGILGEAKARAIGQFDHPQIDFPLLGHGLGTNFIPYIIPLGEGEPDPDGLLKYDEPLVAGMVLGVENFLTRPGAGTAGLEQNLIVTETGVELLTTTPCIFW